MRDAERDQQSAERFAFLRDDQILVEQARATNAELLSVLNEWTDTWDERHSARIADLVRDLQAIRYELVRRRVPHPNGAQVFVQGGDSYTVGDVENASGIAIGPKARGTSEHPS